ncbi:recombinase RecT [Clostridium perfringens]|nr:recombinase RecT [Clostridium perfringens]
MATNSSLKNQLQKQGTNKSMAVGNSVKGLLDSSAMKKRFEEVLDRRAPQFMSSIVNLVNSDNGLQKCEPMSVIASAMVAATLDLPVDKNLGYAWVVPYGGKAQFQMGYKGYIQLALRTGQYKGINVIPVHEGELVSFNPLTEELEIDFSKKESDVVIGYAGYFKLINGFEKTVYWTKEKMITHASTYSKTFNNPKSTWKSDFDAMALKTVLRNMLSKWGILSIDMQNAYTADGNKVKDTILEDTQSIDIQANIESFEYDDETIIDVNDPIEEN